MDLKQYEDLPPLSVSRAGWRGVLHTLESAEAVEVEVTPQLLLLISNCLVNYERFQREGL